MKNTNGPTQLSSEQVRCFYHLFFGLLQHTNEQYKLVKSMLGKNFHDGIDHDDAGKIANYMWSHPTIFVFHVFEYDKKGNEYWRFNELSLTKLYNQAGVLEGFGLKFFPDKTKKDLRFFEA